MAGDSECFGSNGDTDYSFPVSLNFAAAHTQVKGKQVAASQPHRHSFCFTGNLLTAPAAGRRPLPRHILRVAAAANPERPRRSQGRGQLRAELYDQETQKSPTRQGLEGTNGHYDFREGSEKSTGYLPRLGRETRGRPWV